MPFIALLSFCCGKYNSSSHFILGVVLGVENLFLSQNTSVSNMLLVAVEEGVALVDWGAIFFFFFYIPV